MVLIVTAGRRYTWSYRSSLFCVYQSRLKAVLEQCYLEAIRANEVQMTVISLGSASTVKNGASSSDYSKAQDRP